MKYQAGIIYIILSFLLLPSLSRANDNYGIVASRNSYDGEKLLPNNGYVDIHTKIDKEGDYLRKGIHSARTYAVFEILKGILEIKQLWGVGILDLQELHQIKNETIRHMKVAKHSKSNYDEKKIKKLVDLTNKKVEKYYSIGKEVKDLYIDSEFLNASDQEKIDRNLENKSFGPIQSLIEQIETPHFKREHTIAPDFKFYNAFVELIDTSVALSEIDNKINFLNNVIWEKSQFKQIVKDKWKEDIKKGVVKTKVKTQGGSSTTIPRKVTTYFPTFDNYLQKFKSDYFINSGIAAYLGWLQATKDSILMEKEELQYETTYYKTTRSGKGLYHKKMFYKYLYDLLVTKKDFPHPIRNYEKSAVMEAFEKDWKNGTYDVSISIPRYSEQDKSNQEYEDIEDTHETSEDIFKIDYHVKNIVEINQERLNEKKEVYQKICQNNPHKCTKTLLIHLKGFRRKIEERVVKDTYGGFNTKFILNGIKAKSLFSMDVYWSLWNQWKIKYNHKGKKILSNKGPKQVLEYFQINSNLSRPDDLKGSSPEAVVTADASSKYPFKYTVRDEFIQIFRQISKERLVAQNHLLKLLTKGSHSTHSKAFSYAASLMKANDVKNTTYSWVHIVALMLKDHFQVGEEGKKETLDLDNMFWLKMKSFYSTYMTYAGDEKKDVFKWGEIKRAFQGYWNQYEDDIALAQKTRNQFMVITLATSFGSSFLSRLITKPLPRFKNVRDKIKKRVKNSRVPYLAHIGVLVSRIIKRFNPTYLKPRQFELGIISAKTPVNMRKINRLKNRKRFLGQTSEIAINLSTLDFGWTAMGKWTYAMAYADFLHAINFGAASLGISNLSQADDAEIRSMESAKSMIWAVALSGGMMRGIRVINKFASTVKKRIVRLRGKNKKIVKEVSEEVEKKENLKKQSFFIEKAKYLDKKFRQSKQARGNRNFKNAIFYPGLIGIVKLGAALSKAYIDIRSIARAQKVIDDAFVNAYNELFLLGKHDELAKTLYNYTNQHYKHGIVSSFIRNTRRIISPNKWNQFYDEKEALQKFTSLNKDLFSKVLNNGNVEKITSIMDPHKRLQAFHGLVNKTVGGLDDPVVKDLILNHLVLGNKDDILLQAILNTTNKKTYLPRLLNSRQGFINFANKLSSFAPNQEVIYEIVIGSTMSLFSDFILSGPEMFNENALYTMTNLLVEWIIVGYNTFNATASPMGNKMFDASGKLQLKNTLYHSQKLTWVVFASCAVASIISEVAARPESIDETNPEYNDFGDQFKRIMSTSAFYGIFAGLTSSIRAGFIVDLHKRARIYKTNDLRAYRNGKISKDLLNFRSSTGMWGKIGKEFRYHKDYPYFYASIISNWWGTYTSQKMLRDLGIQADSEGSTATTGAFTFNAHHSYDSKLKKIINDFFEKNDKCIYGPGAKKELIEECKDLIRNNRAIAYLFSEEFLQLYGKDEFLNLYSFFKIQVQPRYNKTLSEELYPAYDEDDLTDEELEQVLGY